MLSSIYFMHDEVVDFLESGHKYQLVSRQIQYSANLAQSFRATLAVEHSLSNKCST